MEPLKSMTTSELKQIVNNTDLDYDIRTKAEMEVLRREMDENRWRAGSWAQKERDLYSL